VVGKPDKTLSPLSSVDRYVISLDAATQACNPFSQADPGAKIFLLGPKHVSRYEGNWVASHVSQMRLHSNAAEDRQYESMALHCVLPFTALPKLYNLFPQ